MTIKVLLDSVYPTSVINLKPLTPQEDSPLFVWIPGNPGLLEYYEEMLLLLHKKYPTWEILGISHAGMSHGNGEIEDVRYSPVYTLEQQIDHKVEVINKFSSENRELIIMGHSVGAYMAQKSIMCPQLLGKVIKIGLITPTVVDIHKSQKGVMMTRLFNVIQNVPIYLGCLSSFAFNLLFPSILTNFILTIAMGCKQPDHHAAKATKVFLQNGPFVKQCLGLASHEMDLIRSDWAFQRKLIEHCNSKEIKTFFLFSDSDHWVSETTRQDLIKFYSEYSHPDKLDVHVSEIIPHSFVVHYSDFTVEKYI